MTGSGHRLAALGPAVAGAAIALPHSTPAAITLAAGAMIGSVGPDVLEIPVGESRLIPHRTITHTLIFWVAALTACVWATLVLGLHPVWLFATGFVIGGLSHLSGDLLTPSGIPIWHPGRRWSARICRAGGIGELLWIAATWAVSYVVFLSVHHFTH